MKNFFLDSPNEEQLAVLQKLCFASCMPRITKALNINEADLVEAFCFANGDVEKGAASRAKAVYLLSAGARHYTAWVENGEITLSAGYEKLIPMFCREVNETADRLCREVITQLHDSMVKTELSGYSTEKEYELAINIKAFGRRFDGHAPAFLAYENGLCGVIDAVSGKIIVPLEYEQIETMALNKTFSTQCHCECICPEHLNPAAFYICSRENGAYDKDVYDVCGNLIFTHISDLSVYEKKVFINVPDYEAGTLLLCDKEIVTGVCVTTSECKKAFDEDVVECKHDIYSVEELKTGVRSDQKRITSPLATVNDKAEWQYLLPVMLCHYYDKNDVLKRCFHCLDEAGI